MEKGSLIQSSCPLMTQSTVSPRKDWTTSPSYKTRPNPEMPYCCANTFGLRTLKAEQDRDGEWEKEGEALEVYSLQSSVVKAWKESGHWSGQQPKILSSLVH